MGLHLRGERLTVAEIYDDAGKPKGVRRLRESVEFEEPARLTLTGEFKEELRVDIVIAGEPFVVKNPYVHEGHVWHEVLFTLGIEFRPKFFNGQDRILFRTGNDADCAVEWYS